VAQNYYYNGTQIDTFDGSKGVLVHMLRHDSSADVSLTETDIARANGKSRRNLQTRGKTITLEGTIKSDTTQGDFEQRIDTLKALFLRPGKLKVTNYGTTEYRVATFEEGEAWTGANVSYDFSFFKTGSRGMMLTAGASATVTGSWACTQDLSTVCTTVTNINSFTIWAYVPAVANLSQIKVRFTTTAGVDYFESTWTSFTSGWNALLASSPVGAALTTTGSPSWASITSISITVTATGAGTANITFDDARFVITDDSRTYDVAPSGPLSIPRDHYNVIWVPFSITFSCSDGIASSDLFPRLVTATTTKPQQWVSRYLSGSGKQGIQMRVATGSATPARLIVADHHLDTFGSYANIAAAQNVYNTSGTWTLGSYLAYPTCLREITATGTPTAAVRGQSVQNGELVALLYVPASPTEIGLFGRVASESSPFTSSYITGAEAGGNFVIHDSVSLNNSSYGGILQSQWVWLKLVCKGTSVELWHRSVTSDTWTRGVHGSGAWGIYGSLTAIRCAYLELIDYDSDQKNTLTFNVTGYHGAGVSLDTKALTTAAVQAEPIASGSFPYLVPGSNRLAVAMPSSTLGASSFYGLPAMTGLLQDHFQTTAGSASILKLAMPFSSGANTYIRQRGTFVYLYRIDEDLSHFGDVTVSLQTTAAGVPTGTIVNDVNGNPASVTLSKYSLNGLSASTFLFNASVTPTEVVWGADVAVSAATTYALVFQAGAPAATSGAWYTPASSSSTGGLALYYKLDAGAWTADTYYGYALLEGDSIFGTTTTPASVDMSYTPTFL
jgi:hypothetical protein